MYTLPLAVATNECAPPPATATARSFASASEQIEADERMLREAVVNLCLNALETLEEIGGGQVVLGVGYDQERSLVFIEVEDGGPGIDEEYLELVFEPGFTTRERGNGYGLSIARRIAQAHHGALRVKSRKGHGTVFRLDLPLNFTAAEN